MLRTIILISSLSFCSAIEPYGYHNRVGIAKAKDVLRSESSSVLRIVGGSQVTSSSVVPYQAGIVVALPKETSICGGAVLSSTRILTAAHCWYDGESQATSFTVVLGSLTIFSGGTRVFTMDVTTHPSWNPQNIINDIAVVKIASVSLGTQSSFPSTTSLYQVQLSIITNTECQKSFSLKIQDSHLCTSGQNGKGTCDGDSGGPLAVVDNNVNTLIGIVSFGLGDGCQAGYPSVFSRVSSYLTWIKNNL